MGHKIVDPNRDDRYSIRIAAGLLLLGAVGLLVIDRWMLPVTVVVFLTAGLIVLMGELERPFALLSPEGVCVRILFSKKTYQWKELLQAGVFRHQASKVRKEYLFPVILILPGGSARREGKDPFFMSRNLGHYILLPRTVQILDMVKAHYGQLDFDDVENLNSWEKKYYNFD